MHANLMHHGRKLLKFYRIIKLGHVLFRVRWASAHSVQRAYAYQVSHIKRHLQPLLYSEAAVLCVYGKHWIHSQSTALLLWNGGGKPALNQLPCCWRLEGMPWRLQAGRLPSFTHRQNHQPGLWQPQKRLLFISSPRLGAMNAKKSTKQVVGAFAG